MKNLSDLISGKNTLETAHLIAYEFTTRYGTDWGTEEEITRLLIPKGKAPSWSALDRNINQFAKQFYHTYNHDQDKINFLDTIRFTLQELPQKLDYKLPEHKENPTSPQRVAELFTTCSLCWRAVPRRPLEKKTPLCHLHDLPSNHPTYRKLARTKKQMETIKLELIKSIPPLNLAKQESRAEQNEYIKSLCLNSDSPLQHLVKYIHSLNMPLSTGQEIIRALEHPIYLDKVSSIIRQALEYYFEDRGTYFKLNYLKLLTAEAWLRAGAERKHGGKRR